MEHTSRTGPAGAGCPASGLFTAAFTADPWPVYARLRRTAPVHRDPATGLWLVSRYHDVRRVLLDPVRFRPDNTLDAVVRLSVPALRELAAAGFDLPPTLANNGSPGHAGLRRLVGRLLSGGRVAAAVPLVTRLAERHLDRVEAELAAHGRCDLVAALTRDLPFAVMLEVLGLRADVEADDGVDLATLARWNDASLELFWGFPERSRQPRLARLAAGFHRWLGTLADRAEQARPGLLGLLAGHRHPDGTPLDRREIVAVCYFMVIAGQATTGQMLATMLLRALHDRVLWPRLGREPGLAALWAEEMLRREPPLTTWRRITAGPAEIGGVQLPPGAPLLLLLAATGSDPVVFDAPEELRPGRPRGREHLSFGIGRHRCPGAALARMEAEVVLRSVSARLPTLRPVRPPGETPLLGLLSFRAPTEVLVERS
ncbi:cytochrome P450 [Streptantibioticus cattleyicolor]|uniref:cytochrome P450 n=1 Tax=Streptantibioticus cattleyicolor TaxID=29303 RepID=UPI000213E2BB|nr:cytochrome P450 [Streptantibioticus cattleyicolor]CCB72324.1 Cytochrome P450 [Streptantibioticus cattleyicolor NRRL 8057 = DSM 46488]